MLIQNKINLDLFCFIGCIVFILSCFTNSILAQNIVFYSDLVAFKSDSGVVYFPDEKTGIIFKDKICENCTATYPGWKCFGDLIVDSIMHIDTTILLTDANQIEGVQINSAEFLETLETMNALKLRKHFPGSIRHDTLYWNADHGKWHVLADFSLYYLLSFKESIDLDADSVLKLLEGVPGVSGYNKVAIPHYNN